MYRQFEHRYRFLTVCLDDQTTSVTLYAVYGKRLSHFRNNGDLYGTTCVNVRPVLTTPYD